MGGRQELDDHAESAIRGERDYPPADSNVKIAALAVDSAWLRHRLLVKNRRSQALAVLPSNATAYRRHVNIIAGRASRRWRCKVYG